MNYDKQQIREGSITFQQLILDATNITGPVLLDPWLQEQVDNYELELTKYQTMTPEEAEVAQNNEWEAKEYEISQTDERHAMFIRNYRNMIRQVTNWVSPDKDTKKFILNQLNDDLRTDCGYYTVPRNKKIRSDAWIRNKIEQTTGYLVRVKDDLARKTATVNELNTFRSKILESLGLTP